MLKKVNVIELKVRDDGVKNCITSVVGLKAHK